MGNLRQYIPPAIPLYIPKIIMAMPPLPFSTMAPFKAIGQKPQGGVNATTVSLSGTGDGSNTLTVKAQGTASHRKSHRRTNGSIKSNAEGTGLFKTKKTTAKKKVSNAKRPRGLVRGNGGRFVKKGG